MPLATQFPGWPGSCRSGRSGDGHAVTTTVMAVQGPRWQGEQWPRRNGSAVAITLMAAIGLWWPRNHRSHHSHRSHRVITTLAMLQSYSTPRYYAVGRWSTRRTVARLSEQLVSLPRSCTIVRVARHQCQPRHATAQYEVALPPPTTMLA